MVDLTAGDERFRNDRGSADAAVSAALAGFAAGTGSEQAALEALAETRLLVPVVAVLADGGEGGAEPVPGSRGEMAMPAIVGRDGRRALPAFTCQEALHRWQRDARPVPVPARGIWQSAVQESHAVIIDIAGPVPLAVEGARLAALAAGAAIPALHEDPDVWQLAAAAAGRVVPGSRVKLSAPPDGLDFTLELAPPEGAAEPVPDDVANRIAEALARLLAGRARAGIAVVRRHDAPPAG